MQTALIGRKVINPWDGAVSGTVVGVFNDRDEVNLVVERPVFGATDGRTDMFVVNLTGTIFAPEAETPSDKPCTDPHCPLVRQDVPNGTPDRGE